MLSTWSVFSQCPYTVTASATPATCSTCCNGMITSTVTGFGCAPISYSLDPGGITSINGIWTNLCPGTYTVLLGTGCCIAICGGITLTGGSTQIKEAESLDNQIKLYPNPVVNNLFLEIEQNEFENSEIEILNCIGQTVFKSKLKKEIDVSEFSNGVYILRIKNPFQKEVLKRFVLSR